MRGTPLPTGAYLGRHRGNAVTNTVLQIAIISVAGHVLFGLDWPHDLLSLAFFVALGVVCFASLGVALSHAIPNFDSAPGLRERDLPAGDLHLRRLLRRRQRAAFLATSRRRCRSST